MPKKNLNTKTSTKKNFTGKWGKEHDRKLKALFDSGIINPTDLSSKAIHKVITDHFQGQSYSSFSSLYQGKARKYNIAQSKFGTRKGIKIFVDFKLSFWIFTHWIFLATTTKASFTEPPASIPSQININKEDSSEDEM